MPNSTNPLQAWFRKPAIYIRLPSAGEWWPEGALEIPQNGELPVMPMTALDEISYQTPDALFNGQAVVDVIQSCIPAIRNAWVTPAVDINSVLISIRIASYGHEMEISSTCTHCRESGDHVLDMRHFLDVIKKADYNQTLKFDDIEIFFRPMTLEQQTRVSISQYEVQRQIQQVRESTDLEESAKIVAMTDVMKKLNSMTTQALAWGIAGIRTPNAFVDNQEHIVEYLSQCDRKVFTGSRDHAIRLRAGSEMPPVTLTCDSCKKTYEQAIELNLSNFFDRAS